MDEPQVKLEEAQAELAAHIHEAELELIARLTENKNGSAVSALGIFQEGEYHDRREQLCARVSHCLTILAGEVALAEMRDNEEIFCNVSFDLAAQFMHRSQWSGGMFFNDIDRAIEILGRVLEAEGLSNASQVRAHRDLSVAWEKRWERTHDKIDLGYSIHHLDAIGKLVGSEERALNRAIAACVRFKIDDNVLQCVLEVPMTHLRLEPISFTKVTPKRFRFLDARSLAAGKVLRVLEFDQLPKKRYIALSYVWRGSYDKDAPKSVLGTMSIQGALDQDPISIDVLVTLCKCVVAHRCELLWIDGMCIIQNDELDKSWQIQNMFDIYKHCRLCIVLPGGLSRLVPLDEATSWIHRAWTLQETLAPEASICLFAWSLGNGSLWVNFPISVTVVEPSRAGYCDLQNLLIAHKRSTLNFIPEGTSDTRSSHSIVIRVLADRHETMQVDSLIGAFEARGTARSDQAIWRSSLSRVASRSVDAIFSIMGLFDVKLDPRAFDADDRGAATIALMRETLRQGRAIGWLGVAHNLPINSSIPSFPEFPKVGTGGRAVISTAEGDVGISSIMRDGWWWLEGTPPGNMAADGSLAITAHSLPVRRTRHHSTDLELRPRDDADADWKCDADTLYFSPTSNRGPFALRLGKKVTFSCGAMPCWIRDRPWLIMIVEDAENDSLQITGYLEAPDEIGLMEGWIEREIKISGETLGATHCGPGRSP